MHSARFTYSARFVTATFKVVGCALILAAISPVASAQIVISLHPKATSTTGKIRLRDIAAVRAEEPGEAVVAYIASAMEVVSVPDRGLTISRAQVTDRLRDEGLDLRDFRFDGEKATRVTVLPNPAGVRMAHPVAPSIQRAVLAAAWDRIRSDHPGRVRATVLSIQGENERMARTSGVLKVALIGGARKITPNILQYRARVTADGRDIGIVAISLRVVRVEKRAVARADIPKGTVIGRDDLRAEESERPLESGTQESEKIENVVGSTAKTQIQGGEQLDPSNIEVPVMVKKGQTVRVSLRMGTVAVTMNGTARRAGRRGEWIEIENARSGRVFRAKVTAPGIATVEEESR